MFASSSKFAGLCVSAAVVALVGCGGGGGGGGATPRHALGGTVSGLEGSGLVLRSSVGGDLVVTANGPFTFSTTVAEGTAYAVTVAQQPTAPAQTCTVTNGSATMGASDVSNIAVACVTDSPPPEFSVGGAVAGLAGSGLVLQNNFGEELAISSNGPFAFVTTAPNGAAYDVTVLTQPSSPAQTCTVANGSGTIGAGDVTNVAVTCVTPTRSFSVGGAVAGLSGGPITVQNNGGDSVTLNASGPFTFPTLIPTGSAYAVTVLTKPSSQTCVVERGAGTMGEAAVTDVLVTCSATPPSTFAVGGTVTGLGAGKSVVLANAGVDTTVVANGSYTLSNPVATGAAYTVTVTTQPAGQTCTIANASGTMGTSAVANVNVTCTADSIAIQRWDAPTTWGARWADSPTMVQHAWFDGAQLVEEKGVQWSVQGGAAPAQRELKAFPGASRFGAGPFSASRYQSAGGDSALDLPGDMLVCAVVKPDYNPVTEGQEPVIIAKGIDGESGWVLMQRHHVFNFRYRFTDELGNPRTRMGYSPTFFADASLPDNGPLNPSYIVVCAGRDGDTLRAAVNSSSDGSEFVETVTPGATLLTGPTPHPLTIGGYDNGDPNHGYGGRVYETAIWNEPATPANIQAKLRQVLGLAAGTRYTRNREGPFVGPSGEYHTAWRHAPRTYAADASGLGGGYLFGLQGWNRLTVPYTPEAWDLTPQRNPVIALGEDLAHERWAKNGGAVTLARQVEPPGASEQPGAARVTLPAGASISTQLGLFERTGPIHGMIWIRPVSASGTLRVSTTRPGSAASQSDIDLAALDPNAWNRVWLTGLTTDGSATPATVSLSNIGGGELDFYAWGMNLTQIGGGGDLGSFDPGVAMYDWGGEYANGANPVDVLQLPAVPASTATTGFCLSVEAQPPAGLEWNAPFFLDRSPLSWKSDTTADSVNLFIGGLGNASVATRGNVCMYVSTLISTVCWNPSPAWAAGTKHTITGCVNAAGTQMSLYADGTQVATRATTGTPPDLSSGHLLVGSNRATASSTGGNWQGFVTRALVCPAGDVANCR